MVEIVVPVALFLSIAYAVVGVTRAVMDGRTRRKLLESSASPEMVERIVGPPPKQTGVSATVQWGLVLGAIGIALIVVQYLPYREDDPIVTGLLFVAAALGLLGPQLAARRRSALGTGTPAMISSGTPGMIDGGTPSDLVETRTASTVPR